MHDEPLHDDKMQAEIREEFEMLGFEVLEIGHGVQHLGPGQHAIVVGPTGSPIGTFTPTPSGGGKGGFQPGPPDLVIRVGTRGETPLPEPTTLFTATCTLAHEIGGDGVDEFGTWRGPGRLQRSDAESDAAAHEHSGVEIVESPA